MDFLIRELESTVDWKSDNDYSIESMKAIIDEIFYSGGHGGSNNLDQYFTSSAPISNKSLGTSTQSIQTGVSVPSTSIVSEIAELDNVIKLKELEIGNILFQNVDDLTVKIVEGGEKNADIMREVQICIDDLNRHINAKNSTTEKKTQNSLSGEVDNEQYREFQNTLETLKIETLKNSESRNISILLNNLEDLNSRLLEIPTIVNKCIKTGHYNEALMLQKYCKYTLRSKMISVNTIGNESNVVDTTLLIDKIVEVVDNEIKNTMMYGLIKLLEQVDKFNILKKILNYLINIENDKPVIISTIFLVMRYRYIEKKMNDFEKLEDGASGVVGYLVLKKRIDLMREEMYSTITIYNSIFDNSLVNLPKIFFLDNYYMPSPLDTPMKVGEKEGNQSSNEHNSSALSSSSSGNKPPVSTNTQLLEFINKCLNLMFREFLPSTTQNHEDNQHMDSDTKEQEHANNKREDMFTDNILLQLVYCSFRLNDINVNYHNLMLNKLLNLKIMDKEQLIKAIDKKNELSMSY